MTCFFCFTLLSFYFFFFFNATATTEIYTLSLHDALPICKHFKKKYLKKVEEGEALGCRLCKMCLDYKMQDRKSTRLNSSHTVISYAVFCLKKKKKNNKKMKSYMLIT